MLSCKSFDKLTMKIQENDDQGEQTYLKTY